jgi:hypothetical protein
MFCEKTIDFWTKPGSGQMEGSVDYVDKTRTLSRRLLPGVDTTSRPHSLQRALARRCDTPFQGNFS